MFANTKLLFFIAILFLGFEFGSLARAEEGGENATPATITVVSETRLRGTPSLPPGAILKSENHYKRWMVQKRIARLVEISASELENAQAAGWLPIQKLVVKYQLLRISGISGWGTGWPNGHPTTTYAWEIAYPEDRAGEAMTAVNEISQSPFTFLEENQFELYRKFFARQAIPRLLFEHEFKVSFSATVIAHTPRGSFTVFSKSQETADYSTQTTKYDVGYFSHRSPGVNCTQEIEKAGK